jgi:hypothetical protein
MVPVRCCLDSLGRFPESCWCAGSQGRVPADLVELSSSANKELSCNLLSAFRRYDEPYHAPSTQRPRVVSVVLPLRRLR